MFRPSATACPARRLQALHDDIYARASAGDPTPFKAFRQREYLETVKRLGHLPDNAPLGQRLVEEICMTREVLDVVRWFRARGCLLLAVSDKPDEAAFPTPEAGATKATCRYTASPRTSPDSPSLRSCPRTLSAGSDRSACARLAAAVRFGCASGRFVIHLCNQSSNWFYPWTARRKDWITRNRACYAASA